MAGAQVNGKQPSIPPSQTLYCTNLNDKLQKPDLRRALYILFSTYGPVLDVVALKTSKMRGQAHIVFRDAQISAQAMRALQGFEFFGKQMKISYAKGKSDVISRLDGTAKMPEAKVEPGASTELQKSVFGAPSTGADAAPVQTQALPPVPPPAATDSTQGTKRRRDDESDEEGAPMEEDDEGEAMMEESDED